VKQRVQPREEKQQTSARGRAQLRSTRPKEEEKVHPVLLRPAITFKAKLPTGDNGVRQTGLETEEIMSHLGKALRILSVDNQGFVSEWNATHKTREVRAGDYIVEVNGIVGDIEGMSDAMASDEPLELVMKRVIQCPAPGANTQGRQISARLFGSKSKATSFLSTMSFSSLPTVTSLASNLRRSSSTNLGVRQLSADRTVGPSP